MLHIVILTIFSLNICFIRITQDKRHSLKVFSTRKEALRIAKRPSIKKSPRPKLEMECEPKLQRALQKDLTSEMQLPVPEVETI